VALTPEQRALLELFHDRGLTYEEIGELTGTGADDARRRVQAAETARRDEGPGDPAVPRRTPLLLAVALAGLAVLAGILALTGAFSNEEEDPATPPLATEPAGGDQEVARIELTGTAGSEAQGTVIAGIGADDVPYLDLDLTGLEPPQGGEFHMLWVDIAGGRGIPLPDPIVVAADGSFQERFELPLDTAGVLEVGRALEVVLTDRQAIQRVTREATQAERASQPGQLDPSDLPERPGEAVLRGSIGA
jgi:hypothetical protein